MLWAALYFPHLSLDALLRTRGDIDSPIALITGPPNKRVLLDANDAARAHGLAPGQYLTTASSLLANFEAVAHCPTLDESLLELLLQWAYQFSAMIYRDADNCIVLEIQASLSLFGEWPVFAKRLADELDSLRVRAHLALAPSSAAAVVLAKGRTTLALLQSAMLVNALRSQSLAHTQLTSLEQERLNAMGIHTLGALFSLPRDGLARRFGQSLLSYLDQLRDLQTPAHDFYQPADEFQSRVEFNFDLQQVQALLFPLKRMLADLSVFLHSRCLAVQHFVLQLEHAGQKSALSIGLLESERDSSKLFDLAKLKLDALMLPAPVRAMAVVARHLVTFNPGRADLFNTRSCLETFTELRDRLRIKLGEAAVFQIKICADARPEYCQENVDKHDISTALEPRALQRPGWLLPRAIPLRDVRVEILAGPERIEAGWWDGADVRRDYYVVRTSLAQTAWVFRPAGDLAGPWMLHGWFA